MQRCDEIEGVLAGCAFFGGLWIDNRAGEVVMGGSLSPEASAFIEAHEGGDLASAGREGAYRGRAAQETAVCPACGHVLRTQSVEGVEVDICDTDGTFFDHRELRAFLFARAEAEAKEQTKASQHAAATARQVEEFHFDVREPSEYVRRRDPIFPLLRKLLHDLQRFALR